MGLCEEGIQVATEASEIFEQLGDLRPGVGRGAVCRRSRLAYHDDEQLDAAEEVIYCAIYLFSKRAVSGGIPI